MTFASKNTLVNKLIHDHRNENGKEMTNHSSDIHWYRRLCASDTGVLEGHGSDLRKNSELIPSGRSLLDDFPPDVVRGKLLVRLTNWKGDNLFTLFTSYLEFGHYQLRLDPPHRCFYELILGQQRQKPHFDLDIDLTKYPNIDAEEIKDDLIDALLEVIEGFGINLDLSQDLMLFTSHGEKKKSFHLVVNHYAHSDNLEAKALYQLVIQLMPPASAKFVDHAVYSTKQNFRMVGSQKSRSNRPKILNETWHYHGYLINYKYDENPENSGHQMMLQLEASLVSHVPSCLPLPSFLPETPVIRGTFVSDNIPQELAIDAIRLLAHRCDISTSDPRFPYKLEKIMGNLVILKRVKPSICPICQRVHQHENPYLLVKGANKEVYFHCRRAPSDQKLYIGPVNKIDIEKKITPTLNIIKSIHHLARAKLSSLVKDPASSDERNISSDIFRNAFSSVF